MDHSLFCYTHLGGSFSLERGYKTAGAFADSDGIIQPVFDNTCATTSIAGG